MVHITLKEVSPDCYWGTIEGQKIESLSCRGENDKLQQLQIQDRRVEKLPQYDFYFFKNIKFLIISNSGLKEIKREDLKNLTWLEELIISSNDIESLPGDLFTFNKQLSKVSFSNNKIKYVGVELLDDLFKLTYVNFEGNVNIDMKVKEATDFNLLKLKYQFLSRCQPPKDENQNIEKCSKKHMKKLHEDFDKFLSIDEYKDFTIKVNEKEFKVHKMILIARSLEFAEMIKNNPDTNQLVLTDISVDTFECILNYIYTDEPPKYPRNARDIFVAAAKLKIDYLREICGDLLVDKIEERDLISLMEILNLGIKFKSDKLKKKAFEEIKKHFPGRKLKDDLMEQPEKLEKLIEAKKTFERELEDAEG